MTLLHLPLFNKRTVNYITRYANASGLAIALCTFFKNRCKVKCVRASIWDRFKFFIHNLFQSSTFFIVGFVYLFFFSRFFWKYNLWIVLEFSSREYFNRKLNVGEAMIYLIFFESTLKCHERERGRAKRKK